MRTCRAIVSLLSAAILSGWGGSAQASLNIDLRATAVNGQPLSVGQTIRLIPAVNVGDVISFDVFAVVTGTNGSLTDDRFISVSGSMRSGPYGSHPRTLGNLAVDIVRTTTDTGGNQIPGFDGNGFSVGLQQDLDGDGDLDVGSNVVNDDAHYWSPRYLTGSPGAPAASPFGRKIGFGTFTVTAIQPGEQPVAVLRFSGRNFVGTAKYFQDGALVEEQSIDSFDPLQIGAVFETPEPTSGVLVGLGVSLCLRRSRVRRGAC